MFWRDDSTKRKFMYRGYPIPVDLAFNNIYMIFEVFQHPRFSMEQKCDTIFEIVVDEEAWSSFTFELRVDFVVEFMKKELKHDLTEDSEDETAPPVYDYIEDAGRIHSSFLFDYGMDLREQHWKMDWHAFQELLFNLSDDTQFKKALYYRTNKPPKKTEYNADEIANFKDQQTRYALKESPAAVKTRELKEQELLARMEAHKKKVRGG